MTDGFDVEFDHEKSISGRPLTKEQQNIANKAVAKVDRVRQQRAEENKSQIDERGRFIKKLREWKELQDKKIAEEPVTTPNTSPEPIETK